MTPQGRSGAAGDRRHRSTAAFQNPSLGVVPASFPLALATCWRLTGPRRVPGRVRAGRSSHREPRLPRAQLPPSARERRGRQTVHRCELGVGARVWQGFVCARTGVGQWLKLEGEGKEPEEKLSDLKTSRCWQRRALPQTLLIRVSGPSPAPGPQRLISVTEMIAV